MSYGIMGSTRNSHMLTYQTTKPVKALYFDGESATLMGLGQMDTQMLHVFGNISGPPHEGWGLYLEYARATGLCDWLESAGLRGDGWGYEGIIRMNAGFEMIWCDFTSPSLRLLTHLNVTAPQLPEEGEEKNGRKAVKARRDLEQKSSYYPLPPVPTRTDHSTDPTDPPKPPNWRWGLDREPFLQNQAWGWFSSATYHYGKSRHGPGLGEVRAKVNGCGIMSYYSPRFTNLTRMRVETERELYNITSDGYWKGQGSLGNRSTALDELRRRRRYHHLEDVIPSEALSMRKSSEIALKSLLDGGTGCSGADWVYISNEITQNVGVHVKELIRTLESFPDLSSNNSSIEPWMSLLRSQSHSYYVAFLEYPAGSEPSHWDTDSELYQKTFARCRYRYTRLMAPTDGFGLSLEEEDIRWAIEETYGAICSVLLTIGFQIEAKWAEDFDQAHDSTMTPETFNTNYTQLANGWSDGVQELVAWLGWEDQFAGCSEVCGWDERCYIPMWPLTTFGGHGGRRPPGRDNGTFPSPNYPPPHGYGGHRPDGGGPPHRGPGGPGGGPDQGRPRGRDSLFTGEENELWQPICAKASQFVRS